MHLKYDNFVNACIGLLNLVLLLLLLHGAGEEHSLLIGRFYLSSNPITKTLLR